MFRIGVKYLQYLLSSVGRHGVHSPFVYKLLTQVIYDKRQQPVYKRIEALRKQLRSNPNALTLQDFGAGGEQNPTYIRTIAQIAKTSAKPRKYAQVLYRLCAYHQPKYMLELGTSLGISTAYQAMGAKQGQNTIAFTTLDGSPAVAQQARKNLDSLGINAEVTIGIGNFDEVLPQYLQNFPQLDYVFFDGNHRYQPTIDYFLQCLPLAHENTLFVFDDIRWSDEMEKAWEEIKNHPQVTVTVDLFFIGLVYFHKGQTKQHFTLRF